jgi:acyl-CoA synthetase (AMP-forming)/AMP-acid ligase II
VDVLPERVICVHDLPRSPDGKILKAELREQLLAPS